MPKALVTGASGTVGSRLREFLLRQGWEVIVWDRELIPINDYYRMENFIKLTKPNVLFHLAYTTDPNHSWFVNYEWSSELAWITNILNIKFVFTSTNLVFKNTTRGPFTLSSFPDADSGYGLEKRKTEEKILSQNPNSIIARLGWQICEKGGSNNMVNYFMKKMREEGIIHASTAWLPACSYLNYTCEKIIDLASSYPPDIYMLDSNERWNLFDIAAALNKKFHFGWKVEASNDLVCDNRMIDHRIKMNSLRDWLPLT